MPGTFLENDLVNLLTGEAEELSNAFRKAGKEGRKTPQEIADRREAEVKSFLEKYFPFPFRIVKGNIIDSYGQRSGSVDCVILNPSHPYTISKTNHLPSVIMADGVDAAIEVKGSFVGDELIRGLKQVREVKKLMRRRTGLLLLKKHSGGVQESNKRIPSFIFCESTYVEPLKMVEEIVNFYVSEQVKSLEQFDFIVVNNRFLAINYRKDYFLSHPGGLEGIAIAEYGPQTLCSFLLWLNRLNKSEPKMSSSVIEHYLHDKLSSMQTFRALNNRLLSISE